MPDTITLIGLVGTEPTHIVTSEGLAITRFRLASTHRKYDKSADKWVDGDTNWYGVTAFRQLAINANSSLHKGERVIVAGRVRIKPWDTGEKSGISVDIEADAIGHDLTWGSTSFSRSLSSAALPHASTAGATAPEHSDAGSSSETGDTGSSPAPPF